MCRYEQYPGDIDDPSTHREAYEEGWNAYRWLSSALENPYTLHPDLHQAWMDGYEDAEDHFRAQNEADNEESDDAGQSA